METDLSSNLTLFLTNIAYYWGLSPKGGAQPNMGGGGSGPPKEIKVTPLCVESM